MGRHRFRRRGRFRALLRDDGGRRRCGFGRQSGWRTEPIDPLRTRRWPGRWDIRKQRIRRGHRQHTAFRTQMPRHRRAEFPHLVHRQAVHPGRRLIGRYDMCATGIEGAARLVGSPPPSGRPCLRVTLHRAAGLTRRTRSPCYRQRHCHVVHRRGRCRRNRLPAALAPAGLDSSVTSRPNWYSTVAVIHGTLQSAGGYAVNLRSAAR